MPDAVRWSGSGGLGVHLFLFFAGSKSKEKQRVVRRAAPWKTKKEARRTCKTILNVEDRDAADSVHWQSC